MSQNQKNQKDQQDQQDQNDKQQQTSSSKKYMPDGTEDPSKDKKVEIDDNPDETEKKIPHMKH